MVGTVEEIPDSEPEVEMGKKIVYEKPKQYRGMFEGHFVDFLMYVVAFVAGGVCLYLGLYSPSVSVYRMMRIKAPQTDFFNEKMIRFVAWWAFSASLVVLGGASMFFSVMCFVAAFLRKVSGFFRSIATYLAHGKEKAE